MFIGEKLIYLQMQKTGCTHIAYLLSKLIKGKQIGKHNWLRNYDTDKLIVGSVRNPWDWYVSLWAYGCGKKGGFFDCVTNRNAFIFKEKVKHFEIREALNEIIKPIDLWKKSYEDYKKPNCFKQWLKLVYDFKRKIDFREDYYKYSLNKFAGFMTYRYCKLYIKDYYKKEMRNKIQDIDDLYNYDNKNNILDFVIKMESLEKDIIFVLRKAGYDIDKEQVKFIYDALKEKINPSKHYDSSYYYDDELIKLVVNREKFIIEKYNYKKPKNKMNSRDK